MVHAALILLACAGTGNTLQCAPLPVPPPAVISAASCSKAAKEAFVKLQPPEGITLKGFYCGYLKSPKDNDPALNP